MFLKTLRGLIPALLVALPLLSNAQMSAAILHDHDDSPVSISMEVESNTSFMVINAKNLREITIQEVNGTEVFAWKAKKEFSYKNVKVDVTHLPYRTYIVTARYGTQRYSKVLRLSDGALWL